MNYEEILAKATSGRVLYSLDEICAEYPKPKGVNSLVGVLTSALRRDGVFTPKESPKLLFQNNELNEMFNVPNYGSFKVNKEGKEFLKTYLEKEVLSNYEN